MRPKVDTRSGGGTYGELERKMDALIKDARVRDEVIVLVPGLRGYDLYVLHGDRADVARTACGLNVEPHVRSAFIPWET